MAAKLAELLLRNPLGWHVGLPEDSAGVEGMKEYRCYEPNCLHNRKNRCALYTPGSFYCPRGSPVSSF